MKKLLIGMTLAPRENPTVNKSLKSLRKAGVKDKIYIFAEPWEYNIEDKNVEVVMNKKKLWCFKNFNNAMEQLLKMDSEYIFFTQDDYEYFWDVSKELEDLIKDKSDFWYYNFTSRPKLNNRIYKQWWQNLYYDLGWWVCWLLKSSVIKNIMNSYLYINHLYTYTKNKQIDLVIPHICSIAWLSTYYHNPSFTTHIWETTIGHLDRDLWKRLDLDKETIYWGIASIPSREWELKETVNSVYNQVNKLYVYLNWYKEIPKYLDRKNIEVFMWDNSTGDAGKFYKVEECNWYYFTFDDDLVYNPNYVKDTIKWIEKYNRQSIVWYHWRILRKNGIDNYFKDSDCIPYHSKSIEDVWCHILWTGTVAFHTDTIKVKYKDFVLPNMADIWLWILAQEQNIPMCCLKHGGNEIWTMNTATKLYNSKSDTKKETTVINTIKWNINSLLQEF